MKTKTIFLCLILVAITNILKSQDYSEQAKTYFGKHLDNKSLTELLKTSLPSLDDCKLIFKGQSANNYYGYIEEMKKKIATEQPKDMGTFVDLKLVVFTTNDIVQGKANCSGGMKTIVDKLQSNVTFYDVTLLKEKGAELGVSFKSWIKIENRWVFFPKMMDGVDFVKPEQNNAPPTTSNSTSSNLDFLKKLNGKYPHDVTLLDNSALTDRLKKLISNSRFTFLKATWELESPMEFKNNIFMATGAQAHNAGSTNFIIVYDFTTNIMYAGIREEDKVKTYSEDGSNSQKINEWAK